MLIPDMAAGRVSIEIGAKGINNCSVTACASGANSIGDAFREVQKGGWMLWLLVEQKPLLLR